MLAYVVERCPLYT